MRAWLWRSKNLTRLSYSYVIILPIRVSNYTSNQSYKNPPEIHANTRSVLQEREKRDPTISDALIGWVTGARFLANHAHRYEFRPQLSWNYCSNELDQ